MKSSLCAFSSQLEEKMTRAIYKNIMSHETLHETHQKSINILDKKNGVTKL